MRYENSLSTVFLFPLCHLLKALAVANKNIPKEF